MKAERVIAIAFVLATACSPKSTTSYTAPRAPRPATGAAPWAAPSDPLARARAAGLDLQRTESFTFHIHAHIDVYVNGEPVAVPAGLGIDINNPAVRHGKLPGGGNAYGGIKLCDRPCISPLHTHQSNGIVHVESPTQKDYRLGQFFTEWGVRLDSSCVGGYCEPDAKTAVFVNGKRYIGNFADVVFVDHEEIAIVIGSAPSEIPATNTVPEA